MNFKKETETNGKHYLYFHIRMDTNQIFYVGIGTKYNHDKDYTRAKTIKNRNRIWKNIIKQTDLNILIVHESNDYNEIKQLEISYIQKYGRLIMNEGTLANLSLGGDGVLGIRNKDIIKPVYLYHKTGEFFKEFEAYADCTKFLQTSKSVVQISIDKNHLIKGYILKSYKVQSVDQILNIKEKLKSRLSKRIYQYDSKGNLIKCWNSTSEAAKTLNISGGHIREVANGSEIRKKAGGFIWKYNK